MKITIYELLGLVKDGKAPKKIKYNGVVLVYEDAYEDYWCYSGKYLFEYKFATCNDFLNDYVEIIEDPKKIEKIARCDSFKVNGELYKPTENQEILRIKINELIDEINNLKEND